MVVRVASSVNDHILSTVATVTVYGPNQNNRALLLVDRGRSYFHPERPRRDP